MQFRVLGRKCWGDLRIDVQARDLIFKSWQGKISPQLSRSSQGSQHPDRVMDASHSPSISTHSDTLFEHSLINSGSAAQIKPPASL